MKYYVSQIKQTEKSLVAQLKTKLDTGLLGRSIVFAFVTKEVAEGIEFELTEDMLEESKYIDSSGVPQIAKWVK